MVGHDYEDALGLAQYPFLFVPQVLAGEPEGDQAGQDGNYQNGFLLHGILLV
jgi:hypothetical protein